MKALSIAATGMHAQQLNLDVIANNIANINTTGFKRARAEFSDLVYLPERLKGTGGAGGATVPEGAHVGLGTKPVAVRNLHVQGTLDSTGNALDLAVTGKGWFAIEGPNGETLYSRAGAFNTSADGEIVTADGLRLSPGITVPENTGAVVIDQRGEVFARVAGDPDPQSLGRIVLATFTNEAGLEPLGSNLFAPTAASGDPIDGVPGDPGFGEVLQGYLEDSNVDPMREIADMITAQRAYEMNSKVVQAADEMMGVAARLR